jgi:hypothetical protein
MHKNMQNTNTYILPGISQTYRPGKCFAEIITTELTDQNSELGPKLNPKLNPKRWTQNPKQARPCRRL